MGTSARVSAWVGVPSGCHMEGRRETLDDIQFCFGTGRDAFEFVFAPDALARFVELGATVLAEPEPDRYAASPSFTSTANTDIQRTC